MENIYRFIIAQDKVYNKVLKELKEGFKKSHWMWYIFPQIMGLGESDLSIYYSIKSKSEFYEYINNKKLYNRYLECCNILLSLDNLTAYDIFGDIDELKLKSSLTLFYKLDLKNRNLYKELLDKYFEGNLDYYTLEILEDFN